ncbi:MAG: hypothetical protein GX774_22500, partial [Armatimonadetes bacterium]|nr:hypothetical protein [Armatimonadota bacterium]
MSDHGRRATLRVAWRRCLLCCVLALLAGHSPSATSGPLPLSPPNGGFEDGLRAWRPDRVEGVSAGDVTLVAAGAAEGKQCVCLTGTTARPLIGLTSDPVAVPRGGAYLRLRFRYRTLGEPDELVVRLRPLDEKGQGLTPPANYRYVYLPLLPSAAWQEASLGCLLAPEAVAYDVGFWLRGEGALLVDAVTVQTLGVGDGGVPARGARIQGAHQDAVQVWCESPLKRVYRDTPAPAAEVAAIELAAARGECEPVQVVIVPRADAARVRVRWQDFLGPSVLPREIGRSAWVDYLEVTRTQAPLGRTGWVPDVLDPEDTRDLKGGQVQPIWLTLKVPRNARPGLYQGAVQIESRPRDHWAPPSLPTLRIPIRLRVRDFALPEEPTLTTLVGIDQCPPQGREPLRRNLRQHRVSGESFVGPLPVRIAADGTVQVEFAAFDTAAADYFRTGLRLFAIPGV